MTSDIATAARLEAQLETELEPLRKRLAEVTALNAELEALLAHCQDRLNDAQMGLSLGADGGKVAT
jgi:hypothetical protein